MAALNKRDIEMIFRAETDAAQRPVKELSSDVKKLRTTLDDLTKASNKTDKSLDDLATTARELEKVQSELANSRTLLTQLNSQAAALDRAQESADKATKRYSDLKAEIDATDKPTKRLSNSMDAAERRMNAANQRLEEQRGIYKEVKASIESIIGPVENVQDAFRQVAVTQREVTQGLNTAKAAAVSFREEIKAANDEAAKAQGTEAFKQTARSAGVPESQIAAIAEETNRTELLAKAKQELAAQDRLLRAQAETRSLQFLEAIEKERAGVAALAAAEERLGQVDAFRKVAADALATSSSADRISASLNAGTTSAQRLQEAVLGIVNPAQASSTTLAGMEERLDAVIAKMSGGKITAGEWNHLNNELQAVQASLIAAAAEVDKFAAQQARVDSAAGAYDVQAQKVRELAAAEVTAETDVKALTAALAREEAQLQSLGAALDRETAKLGEMGGALKKVGVDSTQIPQAIQRIEATATKAAPAIKKVSETLLPGGKKGFLGLDPFQLQNLSYQVNDVFTSLGSGIPITQVLAQQGGQILQIFPGALSAIAAYLPVILPLAAGFAVLAGSIAEANTQIETLKTANTVIASLGQNNGYDTKKFQQIVQDFRDIGVSAEDATAATKTFVTEGLNPKAVDDYVIAAKNLADVQGIDVKQATEELTKAFTSGATEVLALDDKYHFLTGTQRDNLAASKDTKNEYIEVNKAFSALYKKMQEGAQQAQGPFTTATNTLRGAWDALMQSFDQTGILEDTIKFISNAVIGFTYLINVARRFGAIFKGVSLLSLTNPIGLVSASIQVGKNLGEGAGSNILAGAEQDTFAQMSRAQAALKRAQQAPGIDAGAGSAGRQRDKEAQAAKDRKQAEQDAKKRAREAAAEAKRRQREAEQLAKQYENEQDQLTAALSRFTVEAMRNTQAPLDQQLELAKQSVDEQFKAIEDRLQEFRAKFGANKPINGMSQEQFAAALNAQKQQIVLSKQLGVYESNVNDLVKTRSEKLKEIQDDQKNGLITAQQALDRTAEVTSSLAPAIDGAISAARQFIAALKPSAETTALLAKFDRIQNQSGPQGNNTIIRAQAQTGVSQNEQDINKEFERRAKLIESANNLYEAGVTNYTQKEEAIRQAYASTNKEITDGIAAAREYLIANQQMLPPDVFANAIAQLDLYSTKLKYTDEITKSVKQSAQEAFSQGFVTMFDTLAQGIADVITGAGSLGDLIGNLGKAALQFAANFAKAIADAIIQIYALRIAKSLIGGFHGGGTVGSLAGGQMRLSRNIGMPDLNLGAVPRYHEGVQGAGLKSNEMLAVLQKGENVQTVEQQKAEANKLKAARKDKGGGLRQVLAFGDDEIAGAMAGPAGEDVVVTHIRRNSPRIRQALGI